MRRFFLGTHRPHWLEIMQVPLFVSHRQLRRYKKLPRAAVIWALDSGGFTELSMNGKWETSVDEYVEAVERYSEIGNLRWAAPMDWMCEPFILGKTGLSIREHQERTVENYLVLRNRSPVFIPVLQGWEIGDYLRCVELYASAGVDLRDEPLVGLGSVCRRQAASEIGAIVRELQPLALHGFGVKMDGIRRYGHLLHSCDSMAWSFGGRRSAPMRGCLHKHCGNCQKFALRWREVALATLRQGEFIYA
jgi:hypothetical protein